VVGVYALALHGAPRASGDIDVFVRPGIENAERVYGASTRFGAPLASAQVSVADLMFIASAAGVWLSYH
jgi:hypothetical protein